MEEQIVVPQNTKMAITTTIPKSSRQLEYNQEVFTSLKYIFNFDEIPKKSERDFMFSKVNKVIQSKKVFESELEVSTKESSIANYEFPKGFKMSSMFGGHEDAPYDQKFV